MPLHELHRELIRIHRSYPALKTGSLKLIYLAQDVIAYGRFDKEDCIVVAVNRGLTEQKVKLPVWELGLMLSAPLVKVFSTGQNGYSAEAEIVHTGEDGSFEVTLPPESSYIWKNLLPPGNKRNKESFEHNFV